MTDFFPRISVLMMTYNQEKLVGRALDSLLCQKEYLYEICINDDCSKDGTWTVLQEYANKYPDFIKPIRNEHNLGIFENIEATWDRPSGDIVFRLAGDDECVYGYFEAVIDFIKENNIDYKKELFCIYGDYLQRFPDGKSILCRQKSAIRRVEPIRLKLRGLVSNYTACFSINILRKYKKISQGRDYSIEAAQDCQLALFTEKNYYVPAVGIIYYAAIGVSVTAINDFKGRDEEMQEKLIEFLENEGMELCKKDKYFMSFTNAIKDFKKDKNFKAVYRMLSYDLKSLDFKLGLDTFYILNKFLDVIKRRRYYKCN